VVDAPLLRRAWGLLGAVSAALVTCLFLVVLWRAGWSPGDAVDEGSPLHGAYLEATTMTFLGIVACQVGTAFASRTEHVPLRTVGVFSNPLLLWGIAFEIAVTAAVVGVPALQEVFGTAVPDPAVLALLVPLPVIVWGVDELRRRAVGRRAAEAAPVQ
jgi:magnesium-transporting ATPase (P-type)